MNNHLFALISRLIVRMNHTVEHAHSGVFTIGKWHGWQLSTIHSHLVDSRTATVIFRPRCGHSWLKLTVCIGQQPLTTTGICIKIYRRQRFFALPIGATTVARR